MATLIQPQAPVPASSKPARLLLRLPRQKRRRARLESQPAPTLATRTTATVTVETHTVAEQAPAELGSAELAPAGLADAELETADLAAADLDAADVAPRYRNGVGLIAYGCGITALALCWTPVTREVAVVLGITGTVLSVLALLHTHVGIANNSALAAMAGLSCLAALALPGILTTIVVQPASTQVIQSDVGGASTNGTEFAACLARSYSAEQTNACR